MALLFAVDPEEYFNDLRLQGLRGRPAASERREEIPNIIQQCIGCISSCRRRVADRNRDTRVRVGQASVRCSVRVLLKLKFRGQIRQQDDVTRVRRRPVVDAEGVTRCVCRARSTTAGSYRLDGLDGPRLSVL